jgi:hypothetical protein
MTDHARTQAFIDRCMESDSQKRECGVDYGEVEVRQAIVHTHQDVWIVCRHLDSIVDESAAIRRRLTVLCVLAVIALLTRL